MTRGSVADEQYGQLWRRLEEVARRVDEGTIAFEDTMRGLQEVIEGRFQTDCLNVYQITMNYGLSLGEMVTAGKYDWVNENITAEHFPIEGQGKLDLEIQLIYFNRIVESNEADKELDRMDLRPATLPELLAFGAKYPEAQRGFPIVALGSVWQPPDGSGFVAYLWEFGLGRSLDLFWLEHRWDVLCRFAAVRE